MPTLFNIDGFRFFFYSNDHAPMHVQRGGGEASFEVRDGIVELRESVGLKVSELRRAEEIALEHRAEIERKWHEHFG